MSQATDEFEVLRTIHDALKPLGGDARGRIVTFIIGQLGIDLQPSAIRTREVEIDPESEQDDLSQSSTHEQTYPTFGEFFAAAEPKGNGDKALLAGYWLQEREGRDSFTSAAANKLLNDLGHKIGNIADAFTKLMRKKPMQVIQTGKTGTSPKGHRHYKVSQEGLKRIREITGG